MTANRMHEWGDGRHTIGFQQADAPVTNVLQVYAGLNDGTVEVSFRSTWAQAGASHSTDGALVLSRVDAEALARVLVPEMMMPSDISTLRRPISATNPLPPGCHCSPGRCQAPRIMGRQTPCRDPAKRDGKGADHA